MKRKLLGLAVLVASFGMVANVEAARIDDVWNELVKDGKLEIPSVAPSNEDRDMYNDFAVTAYVAEKFEGNYYSALLSECNDTYECEFEIQDYDSENDTNLVRNERVQVVWQEADPTIKKLVDGYLEKIESFASTDKNGDKSKMFYINDLAFISSLINYNFDVEEIIAKGGINYSQELNNIFNGANITSLFQSRNGYDTSFFCLGRGALTLWYDGIIYGVTGNDPLIGFGSNYYFYVPEDTENTSEAYIEAAKKRIDDYFGKNDIKIEVAGKIADIEDRLDPEYVTVDKAKMGDYYYDFTINGRTFSFFIMKNSEITTPVTETKDIATNVSVKITSPDVPLDTKIIVNEIAATAPKFKSFVEKLKKEVLKAFDISLYSNSVGNITKLERGVFEVRIPLGLDYVGKRLSAYYIKDDGSLEEHPITLDNEGNAIFETTHFSEYFIAEASDNSFNEEVPKTFDKVDLYNIIAVSGLIGLFSSIVFFRTKTN